MSHPLKQLASIINNTTNCSKDIIGIIISFDIFDYKQFKLDLTNTMKDRINRKLKWEKIIYKDQKIIESYDIVDYEITTIICGSPYKMIICNYNRDNHYFVTSISYNNGCTAEDVSDKDYPRKCLRKLTEKELVDFNG